MSINFCFIFLYPQINRRVRLPVLALLLLQAVQHVGYAADRRVLRLHHPHVLRLLPHAGYRLLLRLATLHPLHLRQHQDGLNDKRSADKLSPQWDMRWSGPLRASHERTVIAQISPARFPQKFEIFKNL